MTFWGSPKVTLSQDINGILKYVKTYLMENQTKDRTYLKRVFFNLYKTKKCMFMSKTLQICSKKVKF